MNQYGDDLYCPKCGSDEIYYARFIVEGQKHWYCDDCGFDRDNEEDFQKKVI